jgi:hypothetical protein
MDFPKTIYVQLYDDGSTRSSSFVFDIEDAPNGIIAIYELKEVKKKVTEVKLEDL